MKVYAEKVKYKKELFTGVIDLNGKEIMVDLDAAIKQIDSIVKQLNIQLESLKDGVNLNETAVSVIREDAGVATDYLPGGAGAGNAEAKYHAQLYIFSKAGQVDELWWCQKDAADTYTWVQVGTALP